MTRHADVEPVHRKSVHSCLGESLKRLQTTIDHLRQTGVEDEAEFRAWLKQWSCRSDQIAHRLRMIDRQLDHLAESSNRGPYLKLIASESRSESAITKRRSEID